MQNRWTSRLSEGRKVLDSIRDKKALYLLNSKSGYGFIFSSL